MKRKITMIFSIILALSIIVGISNFSYAKVSSNDPTVESGGTVSITISTTTAVSCFKIQLEDAGGLTFQSATKGSSFESGSSNGSTINGATTGNPSTTLATYTFKAPEVTETKKYTVKFSVTSMDNEDDTTNTSTVTVKAKQTTTTTTNPSGNTTSGTTTTNPTQNTTSTPTTSTTTTVTEPKFTDTSKTVYATGNINLRSSWSTTSNATKVEKGTELLLTGTSTEKVDGHVWYRVTYNGQIKYVSKDLITETNPNEKSNNVNLKSLTIENVNLEPTFSADTTEYSATIANYDSDKIDITAEAEDSKATVNIEGNTNLVLGENVIVITVTAEDGTTKIYTLTLTLSEEEIESLVLKSLTIKGVELKGFSPEKFEYDVEFKDLDKLEIEAIANEDDATVEILGNENLVEGENTITIIVTSKDGEQIVTYQIKANKLSNESQTQNKELNIKSMVIFGVIAIVILILIIALIIKFVKNNNTPTIDYEYNDNLSNDVDEEKIEQEDIKKDKLYNYDENEKIVKKNRKGKHSM